MLGWKWFRRRKIRKQEFPESWNGILTRNWPLWNRLKPKYRAKMKQDMLIFLDEKNMEGCGGLEITDDIRLTIAAQACVLLLGDTSDDYPLLRSVLVYPSKYRARVNEILPAGIVREGQEWRSGESWSVGTIVLAWDEVQRGAMTGNDGENLVLHEFAHQIDEEYGITDKTTDWLDHGHDPGFEWIKTYAQCWLRFLDQIQSRRAVIFDGYGAQNPAEFFAVATEVFIEKPGICKREEPEMYDLLKEVYGFDPKGCF